MYVSPLEGVKQGHGVGNKLFSNKMRRYHLENGRYVQSNSPVEASPGICSASGVNETYSVRKMTHPCHGSFKV